MYRMLIVVLMVAAFALLPLGASAQTMTVNVQANGDPGAGTYFETSEVCDTSAEAVTFLDKDGATFSATGIASGSGEVVFDEFTAVGNKASGSTYFQDEASGEAFQFWFRGANLTCNSETSGTIVGYATVGFLYNADQTECTQLSGTGNLEITFDLVSGATSTHYNGVYSEIGEPAPCA